MGEPTLTRLFHLTCLIPESSLHDCLTTLERFRVGNVEVRAAVGTSQGSGGRARAQAVHAFWDSLAGSPDMRTPEIRELYVKAGFSRNGIATAIGNACHRKQLKKVDRGLYRFPKEVR
jgi:hypothetical protein